MKTNKTKQSATCGECHYCKQDETNLNSGECRNKYIHRKRTGIRTIKCGRFTGRMDILKIIWDKINGF
jgi:hypothetical protein